MANVMLNMPYLHDDDVSIPARVINAVPAGYTSIARILPSISGFQARGILRPSSSSSPPMKERAARAVRAILSAPTSSGVLPSFSWMVLSMSLRNRMSESSEIGLPASCSTRLRPRADGHPSGESKARSADALSRSAG